MNRDLLTGAFLLIAWVCTTLGIATQDWWLTGSGAPSLTVALILHLTQMSRRTKEGQHTLQGIRAQRTSQEIGEDILRSMDKRR